MTTRKLALAAALLASTASHAQFGMEQMMNPMMYTNMMTPMMGSMTPMMGSMMAPMGSMTPMMTAPMGAMGPMMQAPTGMMQPMMDPAMMNQMMMVPMGMMPMPPAVSAPVAPAR